MNRGRRVKREHKWLRFVCAVPFCARETPRAFACVIKVDGVELDVCPRCWSVNQRARCSSCEALVKEPCRLGCERPMEHVDGGVGQVMH